MEKSLHTEDPSLKKESGKHKKKLNLKTQKIRFYLLWSKREGFQPSFFINKYNYLVYIYFTDYRLLKELNFDAFAIDLNYLNGKFNSVIKR